MSPTVWLMLIVLSFLWGGSFFFFAVLVAELPTFTIVVGRTGLAALSLLVFMKIIGAAMPWSRSIWLSFFGMGLLNNVVPFSLIAWGQTEIASGVASILNAATPLFTLLVAHVLTEDEKITGPKLSGLVLGFFGVVVMIGGDAFDAGGTRLWAAVAILAATLSYALAGVFGRRFKRMGVPPMATAAGQVTASTVLLLPVVLVVDQPWSLASPSGGAWAALIGVAVFSTAVAYVLYFRILATAGATNLLLVTLLIPVSANLLGIGFLDEVLLTQHFVGIALIAAGLSLIDGRVLRLIGRRGSTTG